MNKNDILTLKIEDISDKGLGIAKTAEGRVVFVKNGVLGDTVEAVITKVDKRIAFAKVLSVIEASPYRVEGLCDIAEKCGGCQIQTLSYEKQLEWKERQVKNDLIHIGHFDASFIDEIFEPIVGMENPFRFRNKASYPVRRGIDGKNQIGFYVPRTHYVIPVTECMIGPAVHMDILKIVNSFMEKYKVSAYDEENHNGLIRHILIRNNRNLSEIMVCIILNGNTLPHEDALVEMLKEIPQVSTILLNINTEKTNVILGLSTKVLLGSGKIQDYLEILDVQSENSATARDTFIPTGRRINYEISAHSFYQVNPIQAEKLYSIALDYAALTGSESVWDLYCGIGSIGLFMSDFASKVYGIEIVHDAILNAKNNAKLNGVDKVEFFEGKAEVVLPDFYKNNSGSKMLTPDVIVVDPPRKGCDKACMDTMLEMNPSRIVYVSCDPATLARDLSYLTADGQYTLSRVRCVDQFCHSTHVETVCLLSRKVPV